jgi:hypothetical protein
MITKILSILPACIRAMLPQSRSVPARPRQQEFHFFKQV